MTKKNRATLAVALILSGWCATASGEETAGAESGVDVARFARVLWWDPGVMEGTKASRSDEMPAEDVAPYKEVLPAADGGYTAPTSGDVGCIGLEWDENRILELVAIEFSSADARPAAESVELQYWTGESAWQGRWQPAATAPETTGSGMVWRFGPQELPQGTQKVRWVFSGTKEPVVLKDLTALTRSQWQTFGVRIEPARPGGAKKAQIEVYNGDFVNSSAEPSYRCAWDGAAPLVLKVRGSARQPYKADRTVLRFQMPGAAFGVAVEDLLAQECVYVPHANVFITRDPSPIAPAEYIEKITARKSVLAEVRQRPDQDLRRVCEIIHNPQQDRHNWAPMLISLACDNRKFLVHRDGPIVFNEYTRPDDYPGESDGVHTIAANVGQWRFVPSFGDGQPLELTRRLGGGWLPMPVSTLRDKSIAYEQTTFVAPVGESPAGSPVWLRERALGVVEYVVKNTAAEPAAARLSFQCASQQDPAKPVEYQEVNEGVLITSGDHVLAFVDTRKTAPLSCEIEPTGVALSGTLGAGGACACTVYLPAWKSTPEECVSLRDGGPWAGPFEAYWKSLMAPAMQVEIPDEWLGNLIRASQVNCLSAARNEDRGRFVVPWISSIHFAYPESEANAVIRGMDMMGHADFARRGLEFYLSRCNAAGYITILINAPGGKVGYTMVGTGEVLWTLGEHFERTGDKDWLRTVAPEVVRICQWVARQREKTKRVDAQGQNVPEYGLAPPGVSADWNRFAYRFFNDAQYYHGLAGAGQALVGVGDPAAAAILKDAEDYRKDIIRAYHSMQAKMPVVLLRNGTWAPADPSLVGCYGNVEDFLPGEDANRSYVYSVELGAHHLVANGALDPASNDADWMIDYLEDVQFLRTRWVADPSKLDVFDWGGFAKMQPYYCRIAEIHTQRDDVKPFVRSYFNAIPALLNFEELTFWEDVNGPGYATGAFNKTHETGWFLGQTRTMFVTERGDELWLAPFVTNQWLQDGQKVAIRNAPTRFGKVSYAITSRVGQGAIEAAVELPAECTAKRIVLRLRHPDGKPIQSVTVQGKPHAEFDPHKDTITFVPADEPIAIRATY